MKRFILAAALITALLLVFTGCSNANPDASASPLPSASTEIVDPSASPTESPAETDNTVTVKGSDIVYELVSELGSTYMDSNPDVVIDTSATNSNTAIASVADGNADIALSSRPLKDEEKAVFPGLKENLICKDGLVVVVSNDCPITALSAQQVRDIFLGTITNWAEAGGEDGDISAYAMGTTTEIRKRFNELFLGTDEKGAQNDSTSATAAADYSDMADKVGADAAAIGYMPLSAIPAGSNIKAVIIDQVPATSGSIKTGRYVYALNYFLITNDPSANARAFVDYCMTGAKSAIAAKKLIIP